jgi:HAD superfamily hydrolase (TIGR01509 family)
MVQTQSGRAVRAALFDCDGLLVSTENYYTLAQEEIFARRGQEFTTEHKKRVLGHSIPESGELMAEMLSRPGDGRAIADELLARMEELVSEPADPLPGVSALIDFCEGRVAKAVVSNAPRSLVDATLRSAGLTGRMDEVIAVEDAPRPKPFPDLYLRGAAALGVEPNECIAFEDSPTGVRAAHAAGIRVVGVPSHGGTDIGADWHVRSLNSLAARALLIGLFTSDPDGPAM